MLTCNSAYSIHPIFGNYDFIKDFWLQKCDVFLVSHPLLLENDPGSKVPNARVASMTGFIELLQSPVCSARI